MIETVIAIVIGAFVLKVFMPDAYRDVKASATEAVTHSAKSLRVASKTINEANRAIAKELKAIDDEIDFSDQDLEDFLNGCKSKASKKG